MAEHDVLLIKSAAAAYRKDAIGRSEAFGDDDGGWIAVTTLVQHAAAAPENEALVLLRDAVELSESMLGAAAAEYRTRDADAGQASRSDSEVISALASTMERAGARHLAWLVLEALSAADRSLSTVEYGRIQVLLARVIRRLGDLDRAEAMYERVARLGRSRGEPELVARAAIGLATVMQLRGDYGAARRWATKSARLARRQGFSEIARVAEHGLMVIAAKVRDFDAALVHGWAAYELSLGDTAAMDELLSNLGQLLLDVGHPEPARAAFASVLSRPQPARIGLPALGGLAGTAARIGDLDLLGWSVSEVFRELEHGNHHYQFADALCDCAAALSSVGDVVRAEQCATMAFGIAERFGYGDVQTRAAALRTPVGVARSECLELAPRARRVVHAIQALDPARLPDHVVFAAVA
ncbi:MAG TPA: tetratricopeptide repeat protein [Gemmatimonadaceae bacterium]|jgi:tetratricopeptide (TPR) repeat protein